MHTTALTTSLYPPSIQFTQVTAEEAAKHAHAALLRHVGRGGLGELATEVASSLHGERVCFHALAWGRACAAGDAISVG